MITIALLLILFVLSYVAVVLARAQSNFVRFADWYIRHNEPNVQYDDGVEPGIIVSWSEFDRILSQLDSDAGWMRLFKAGDIRDDQWVALDVDIDNISLFYDELLKIKEESQKL